MTQPEKDEYVKLIRKLRDTADARTGPFKRPNPNKDLLKDAYDAIVNYVSTIEYLEKQLAKEFSYKGYPISALATLANFCELQGVHPEDVKRFIYIADFAMEIGYKAGVRKFEEEVEKFKKQLTNALYAAPTPKTPEIEEVKD